MLKLVGTEAGKILDEKVIIDDDNKLTSFAYKVIVIDILLDMCLFLGYNKIKGCLKRKDKQKERKECI